MKILITPLHWGLGHASRCVPIIQALLQEGHKVMIASDGAALHFLQHYFPELSFFELPSYRIQYPFEHALLNFRRMAPRLLYAALREKKEIKKLVRDHKIEVVISDNRLGCYTKKAHSIYITHQLQFAFSLPILNKMAAFLHFAWYRHFDQVWVPDLPPPHNIAAKLSVSPFGKKVHYIGLLSHLEKQEAPMRYRSLSLLSGPEPQRTRLEQLVREQLPQIDGEHLLVQGIPGGAYSLNTENNLSIRPFLAGKELGEAIAASDLIICRSGYSSLMDLVLLQKKAILIPTPGQPEQQYLADQLKAAAYFVVEDQNTLDLQKALSSPQRIPSAPDHLNDYLLAAIRKLPNRT